VVIRFPATRAWLTFQPHSGVVHLRPIAVLAAASILFAVGAGNEWMTSVFLLAANNEANPMSVPLVLIGQAAVGAAVLSTDTARFGLTAAIGMSILTIMVMPLNVLGAFIGENFQGPRGEGGSFLLFMLAQCALCIVSVSGAKLWKQQHGGPILESRAILAVIGWGMAFAVTHALFAP
jgi:hypothetical protein